MKGSPLEPSSADSCGRTVQPNPPHGPVRGAVLATALHVKRERHCVSLNLYARYKHKLVILGQLVVNSIHVLMRDEKEGRKKQGRKKQARSNKQQGKVPQHTHGSHFSCTWVCCVALPCCVFDLACFFFSSFSSLIKTCIYIYRLSYRGSSTGWVKSRC